jgi:glycosyltransferase involved in cell wall biosynthesis
MVVFYFGADAPYEELLRIGFKRRNTILLRTIANSPEVKQVYCMNYAARGTFIKYFFKNFQSPRGKVKDIYFSEPFVIGKFKSRFLSKAFNRVYFSFFKVKLKRENLNCWVYWPNGYEDYKLSALSVDFLFDADHNLTDDPNLHPTSRNELLKILEEVARRSNLIVSASLSMLDWFLKNGAANTFRLRNGIESGRFNISRVNKREKFTAVYCGILSHWVNYDLFLKVIIDNPEIDFVIIGRAYLTEEYSNLNKLGNVYILGEKTPAEVAALLPEFHVGLGLYKTSAFLDGDSMKVYEYLAAGLAVVCTDYHKSLKSDFDNLLFTGNSSEEFNQILNDLKSGKLKNDHPGVEAFLQDSTWENRVSEVLGVQKNIR